MQMLWLLVLSLLSAPASGDLADRLMRCAAVEDSLQRLRCFDDVTASLESPGTAPLSPKAEESTESGYLILRSAEEFQNISWNPEITYWLVREEENPVDDTRTATAMLFAADTDLQRPVSLMIRCLSRKTDILVNWNEYLGSSSPAVLIRIDSDEPITTTWSISTDKRATFFRPIKLPKKKREPAAWLNEVGFLKKLLIAERLVAQTTPYGEGRRTVVFRLTGITEAIEPVRRTCGW